MEASSQASTIPTEPIPANGKDLQLYRQALGVGQAEVGRAMRVTHKRVSVIEVSEHVSDSVAGRYVAALDLLAADR